MRESKEHQERIVVAVSNSLLQKINRTVSMPLTSILIVTFPFVGLVKNFEFLVGWSKCISFFTGSERIVACIVEESRHAVSGSFFNEVW